MKKIGLALGLGIYWLVPVVGMFDSGLNGSSSSSSFKRVSNYVGTSNKSDIEVITHGMKDFHFPEGSWGQYSIKGMESLQIILNQNQARLTQREKTINCLKTQEKSSQRIIQEQNQVIDQQNEALIKINKEVSSFKSKTDVLEKEIQEKDKQIQIRNREFSIVEQERDEYKDKLSGAVIERDKYKEQRDQYQQQNRVYETNLNMIKEAVDEYAASWAEEGDFKIQYDNAKTINAKVTIVMAHLIKHNAKRKDALQRQETALRAYSDTNQTDLTLNTIVDATRHDFLRTSKNENNCFPMGNYEYIGPVNAENKPNGKGKIVDKNGAMEIEAAFSEGFLDITKPVTFRGSGLNCTFEFPNELDDVYRSLISFVDIADTTFSFGVQTLIFSPNNVENGIGLVFNQEYIYVGQLKNDKPHGAGIKFYKNGSIKEGRFEQGFLVEQRKSAKRKRIQ